MNKKSKEQELIDITFSIGLAAYEWAKTDNKPLRSVEEVADWIRSTLRSNGFETFPLGSSWGVLVNKVPEPKKEESVVRELSHLEIMEKLLKPIHTQLDRIEVNLSKINDRMKKEPSVVQPQMVDQPFELGDVVYSKSFGKDASPHGGFYKISDVFKNIQGKWFISFNGWEGLFYAENFIKVANLRCRGYGM